MESATIEWHAYPIATCPYCGEEQDIESDRGEKECDECGKEFSYTTDI